VSRCSEVRDDKTGMRNRDSIHRFLHAKG